MCKFILSSIFVLLFSVMLHINADNNIVQPNIRESEEPFINNVRQLIYKGVRSGEGYFSLDDKLMIFQAEREQNNPFFQIYLLNMETGATNLVSTGKGKTTCGFIFPDKKNVIFSSTHLDPETDQKMLAEFEKRKRGERQRGAWDFDYNYDIFTHNFRTGQNKNITNIKGYDAEASISKDGKWIVFASNRNAYNRRRAKDEEKKLDEDPSFFMDIYIMRKDGKDVKQLTFEEGYDGGPFFSPNDKKIVYRRFNKDGKIAEIYTMNVDGSSKRQITNLGATSWAPFFHPSGDYIIFTTSLHGHDNFELYVVDRDGEKKPVRITYKEGFDGLPVFTNDGNHLVWTSGRTADKKPQIFYADWNDQNARYYLGLASIKPEFNDTSHSINEHDIKRHIEYLSADALTGRLTGTKGEEATVNYLSSFFSYLKIPEFDGLKIFQFTKGVSLDLDNYLTIFTNGGKVDVQVEQKYLPLAFSANGKIEKASLVFAGYGIVAPSTPEFKKYDSYTVADNSSSQDEIDVKGKWVIMFQGMPENVGTKEREHLLMYSSLRYKAMAARDRGASGVIFVRGPNLKIKREIIKLSHDASLSGSGIMAISITDNLCDTILNGKLKDLQTKLDSGEQVLPFLINDISATGSISLKKQTGIGNNSIFYFQTGKSRSKQVIVLGAHLDHLGVGFSNNSRAGSDESDLIHHGADDNASGVSAVMELAQYFVQLKNNGKLKKAKRDIIFALWSGEELGALGSSHFIKEYLNNGSKSSQFSIDAYLNIDMIGRFRDKLVVQGSGSSPYWMRSIEMANASSGLPLSVMPDPYVPSDGTQFYINKIPILHFFTGSHEEYHTPKDTVDKINLNGEKMVTEFIGSILLSMVLSGDKIEYREVKGSSQIDKSSRGSITVYIGTIPDYTRDDINGVLLSGVKKDSPAEQGGLKGGDIIKKIGEKQILNIYDYTFTLKVLQIGKEVEFFVLRDGHEQKIKIIPGSRE